MAKKILFLLIIVLLLIGGGVFYWWQNQEDVKELNKGLPEGVRVVKNLKGEYWVVNRIDGYEFRVPGEWEGLKEIEYISEREVEGYVVKSLDIIGLEGEARGVSIDIYRTSQDWRDLDLWAKQLFETFDLAGLFQKEILGSLEIIKTKEDRHLGGVNIFFMKADLKIYVFTGGSEEYIREIIISGKW